MSNASEQERTYSEEEYYALSLPVRTELINWRIYYLSSPSMQHQNLLAELSFEIQSYIKKNKGKCKLFFAPCDVKLRDGVIVQPDIFVTCNRDKIDNQYHNGAPDWIIEIASPGNPDHDYYEKLLLYKENGVKEYWIIDPMKKSVLTYVFEKSNTFKIYTFADIISAEIYKSENEPLSICINDLEY